MRAPESCTLIHGHDKAQVAQSNDCNVDNSYQRTIDMVFDAEDEEGDEYVISQDEIVAYFQRAYVTR